MSGQETPNTSNLKKEETKLSPSEEAGKIQFAATGGTSGESREMPVLTPEQIEEAQLRQEDYDRMGGQNE